MLDQNTDRMWYVIGAVIIGASIILIMNSTFPQLFASVGNTFKDKTADVGNVVADITMTDGMGPVQRENMVVDGQIEKVVHNSSMTEYSDAGVGMEQYIYYDLSEVLKPSTQYTFAFDYKSTTNVESIESFFLGNTPTDTRKVLANTNGEWSHVTYTFTTNNPTVDPETSWWSGDKVRFDNNFSKTTERSTLWVKNVSVVENGVSN